MNDETGHQCLYSKLSCYSSSCMLCSVCCTHYTHTQQSISLQTHTPFHHLDMTLSHTAQQVVRCYFNLQRSLVNPASSRLTSLWCYGCHAEIWEGNGNGEVCNAWNYLPLSHWLVIPPSWLKQSHVSRLIYSSQGEVCSGPGGTRCTKQCMNHLLGLYTWDKMASSSSICLTTCPRHIHIYTVFSQ